MQRIYVARNRPVFVDDEDYERVRLFRWHILVKNKKTYIVTYLKQANGNPTYLHLSRMILGEAAFGRKTGWINKNRFDYQKHNLKLGGVRVRYKKPIDIEDIERFAPAPMQAPMKDIEARMQEMNDGTKRFILDPNSRLGPVIQRRLWRLAQERKNV